MNPTTLSPTNSVAGSLTGVRVVVTHDKEQATDQTELLAALGAEVLYYPCIEILPYDNHDELDAALHEAASGKYDWLVLNDADTAMVVGERMRAAWGGNATEPRPDTGPRPHEAGLLRLDTAKARSALGWRPSLPLEQALDWIVAWHKAVGSGKDARAVTLAQIAEYAALAPASPRRTAAA